MRYSLWNPFKGEIWRFFLPAPMIDVGPYKLAAVAGSA